MAVTVTSDQMYAWLLAALRDHPGGAADPYVAQRLSGPLAALFNDWTDARLEGGVCSRCDEPALVVLNHMPFCVAHLDEAFRGIRAIVETALRAAEGAAAP